jgi:hypothetical protein
MKSTVLLPYLLVMPSALASGGQALKIGACLATKFNLKVVASVVEYFQDCQAPKIGVVHLPFFA